MAETQVVAQSPQRVNLALVRGDSLTLLVHLWQDAEHTIPADLSQATLTAQVREDYDDTEVIGEFDVTVDGGDITLTWPPKYSRGLPPVAHWDLEVDWYSDDHKVQTMLAGAVAAEKDVSRHD